LDIQPTVLDRARPTFRDASPRRRFDTRLDKPVIRLE